MKKAPYLELQTVILLEVAKTCVIIVTVILSFISNNIFSLKVGKVHDNTVTFSHLKFISNLCITDNKSMFEKSLISKSIRNNVLLKGNGYTFMGGNAFKIVNPLLEKGSISSPLRANSFLLDKTLFSG